MNSKTLIKLPFSGCLVLASWTVALGQDQTSADKQQILDQVSQESLMGTVQTYDNRYEGVKGNPFLNEDWQVGAFVLTDGSTHENLPLRYDILSDELHFQNKMKIASVVPPDRLKKFTLRGEGAEEDWHFTKAKYFESLEGVLEADKILQLLYDNGYQLVAVRYKAIKKADYQGGYSRNKPYDEITEISPKYYLLKPGEPAEKIKPKKKSLMKAFPEQAERLEKQLKVNKYNLADPNDVARLLKHLN